MKRLIFSVPTTIAYIYECLGFIRLAQFFYHLPLFFDYAPAQYKYGMFHVIGEKGKHTDGVFLIRLAAEQDYDPACEWIRDFKHLIDMSDEDAKSANDVVTKLFDPIKPLFLRNVYTKYGIFVYIHTICISLFYDIYNLFLN